MIRPSQSICMAKGFSCLGKACGIKDSNKKDLAVIFSVAPCRAAAVYTRNRVKGAPLLITRKHLRNGQAQAVVVNSGVSNVCTGARGLQDAEEMARLAGAELGLSPTDVLVASTGVIGVPLPMAKIRAGLKGIRSALGDHPQDAAEAILTTDTHTKQAGVRAGRIALGGIAKGSGMIHPNLATMLAFLVTDARFPSAALQRMLRHSVDLSFNMTSVDGDTSTSDMVLLLANGLGGAIPEAAFQKALDALCMDLAQQIAADGEGATKLLEVIVRNARSERDARLLARAVTSSNLVKAALYGNDANWGRILAALGRSGGRFDPGKVDLFFGNRFGNLAIVKKGQAIGFDPALTRKVLASKAVRIVIDLREGRSEAVAWGCDLSLDYVKINAEYRT